MPSGTNPTSEENGRPAHQVYVTLHGHFYQPPRENPYLEAIERQDSAAPCHDWNERIYHECYRPNAFARVFNDRGAVVDIVNNFEYLSFNIGPTLFSWLEQYDPVVYQRILEGDRRSCARLNGHGNAIAQVYNHIIMPLANLRDRLTQVRWAKADFRRRFGREPEGIWLAETAVDYETLAILVAEGFRFTILAPSQVQRCRPVPTPADTNPAWHEVGGGQVDPNRPYRCRIPDAILPELGQGRSIDIFVYDGPISRDMGFGDVLASAHHLVGRLALAVRADWPVQLIPLATDGETFGHHKRGAEKTLAYALTREIPQRGWQVTNFAHYLSLHPPTWELEIKPGTAWSCAHGVDRWQADCGCGGGGGWHQKWRKPLRESLNWLRDQVADIYEQRGADLFRQPWAARDAYITVIQDRRPAVVQAFLEAHQHHPLSATEQVEALQLLEMQRHALLMFTSCGWFFEELSRPEGVQILRYAARAMELAVEVAGLNLEPAFLSQLGLAPSNVEQFGNGDQVYEQLVRPAQVSFEQVAAHYAIRSLFTTFPRQEQLYCYAIDQEDAQLRRLGALSFALGVIRLTSTITWESRHLIFAVLHLGGWDFHCGLKDIRSRRGYVQLKERLLHAFSEGSAARTTLAMGQLLPGRSFGLGDLFPEERHQTMRVLAQETLTRLDQLYSQVYRENYGVLLAFQRDGLAVPRELQVAAEIALGQRVMTALRGLELDTRAHMEGRPAAWVQLAELESLMAEMEQVGCRPAVPEATR
ncbi:MAG: DUF3536 domain-containing protein, partial [Gloeomargaritaceae cyanobacterium C42_A2020_066]|nr:DUF3536 domain-containing protein [Gloeomargaritaceae cyanobacterium C42_A2020_066]